MKEAAHISSSKDDGTRQSNLCGFCIKINGQVGQGGEDGLVWSGLFQKDSQDDFDSEYIGFDGTPDD